MSSERPIIEGGGAARATTCTCGDDLARNGFTRNGEFTHNYICPMTPKCQNTVTKIDPRTGQPIQAPCGSRLEPQFACHSIGCPELPLCPHCGTPMDRRGVHSIGCPNRPSYSFVIPRNSQDRFHDDTYVSLLNFMQEMPVIPPRCPVSRPSIIDGDFEIKGQCSICLDDCEQSQRVMKPSECDHCFHENCLTPWIQEHSTCPNCRRETQTILRKK